MKTNRQRAFAHWGLVRKLTDMAMEVDGTGELGVRDHLLTLSDKLLAIGNELWDRHKAKLP